MNKAIFLDRDGTIIIDRGYLSDSNDVEFLQGAILAMKKFIASGFKLIIVTNQSGVGRGYYKEEDVVKVNNYIQNQLSKISISILDFYYCPHYIGSPIKKYDVKCDCRKPYPGMILQASRQHNICLQNSFMIGDKVSDVLSGQNAKVKNSYRINEKRNLLYYSDLICDSLEDFN